MLFVFFLIEEKHKKGWKSGSTIRFLYYLHALIAFQGRLNLGLK